MNFDFLGYILLFILLVISTIHDIKAGKISNRIILGGLTSGFVFLLVQFDTARFLEALAGVVISAGSFFLVSLVSKGGIGMGDVKLFGCIALFVHLPVIVALMLTSVVLSGIGGMAALFLLKYRKKDKLPFAPFILAGCIINFILIV